MAVKIPVLLHLQSHAVPPLEIHANKPELERILRRNQINAVPPDHAGGDTRHIPYIKKTIPGIRGDKPYIRLDLRCRKAAFCRNDHREALAEFSILLHAPPRDTTLHEYRFIVA